MSGYHIIGFKSLRKPLQLLEFSLVQELVGAPLPEAHPAVGPAGRQQAAAAVRVDGSQAESRALNSVCLLVFVDLRRFCTIGQP